MLTSRLGPALAKLNPDLPPEAIESAIEQLTRDRSALSPVQANREIYRLLKNGIKVELANVAVSYAPSPQPSPKGRGSKAERARGNEESIVRVKVIDWENPANNEFFLA